MKAIDLKQKLKIGLLILMIATGAGIYAYQTYNTKLKTAAQQELKVAQQAEWTKRQYSNSAIREKYNLTCMTISYGSNILPLPEWQQTQAHLFKNALLANGSYDSLVVPFQRNQLGLDVNSRLYMSEALVQSLQHAGEKVPPADVVRNILGMHMSTYRDEDIYILANELGVKKIYWGFADLNVEYIRDKNTYKTSSKLLIQVIRQEKTSAESWSGTANLQYSDYRYEKPLVTKDLSPIETFNQILPELDATLGINDSFKKRLYTEAPKLDLDKSAPELIQSSTDTDPLVRAHYLQWLAELVPKYENFAREDFIIKSLVALNEVDPASVDYPLLISRAYLHLYMRPRALAVLGTPDTAEKKALYQLLNGNLDGLKETTNQIERAVPRAIAEIQYLDLDYYYTLTSRKDEMLRISGLYPAWQYELLRRLADPDLWIHEHSNLDLKAVLDEHYPLSSYSLNDIMASAQSDSGNDAVVTLGLAFQKHLDAIKPEKLKEKIPGSMFSDAEYLQLMESIGQANLVRSIRFYADIQGAYSRALELSDKFNQTYKGHPEFMNARADALRGLSEKKSGKEEEALVKEAGQLTNSVLKYYLPAMQDSWPTLGIDYGDLYLWEYRNIRRLQEHVSDSLEKGELDPAIKTEIQQRFQGDPKKIDLEILIAKHEKDWIAVEKIYADAIQKYPETLKNFEAYEKIKLYQGDPEAAAHIASQYKPLFDKKTKANSVGLANDAYNLGNMLFWDGHYTEALPFYEVAAKLDTGSSSSNISQAKIAVLNRDYVTAAEAYYENATHYDKSYSYNAYLSLLYITGESAKADALLNSIVHKIKGIEKWNAALTGRRIERQSNQNNCEWLNSLTRIDHELVEDGDVFLAHYLLSRIDRDLTRSADLSDACEFVLTTTPPSTTSTIAAGHQEFFISLLEMDRDIAQKKYVDAKLLVEKLSATCGSATTWKCDFSPYAAWIEINQDHTVDGKTPEEWLSANTNVNLMDNYTVSIKKAVVANKLGRFEDAVKYMQQALVDANSYSSVRIIPVQYELLEFCERFYLDTHDSRYKILLLDWSKKFQHLEPWNAWPYSFEAKYTDNAMEKNRALAIGLYLDRDSTHLSEFSEHDRAEAEKWFIENQPFESPAKPSNKPL